MLSDYFGSIQTPTHHLPVQVQLQIRWLIRRDMPEVLRIENDSFPHPWSEDDFIRCQRQRNCIGLVVEHAERIIAFVIYELHRGRLHILNFAVHPGFRRAKIGAALVEKLKTKLSPQRRREISTEISEDNLLAQQFFRSQGFKSAGIRRNSYIDHRSEDWRDSYRMIFTHPAG